MSVPYIFANTPGGQAIPLAHLDADFAYLDNKINIKIIDTISDLRALSFETTINVLVNGYYSNGDGGGGYFYPVVGSIGQYVDNGGTIIVPTGGNGSKAWIRQISTFVSVKFFGAKGDNSHNDTTAIQSAIDACGSVLFPKGQYRINQPLSLNSYSFLIGEGRESKIYSTYSGAMFKGKNVTPSSGTNIRVYSGGGRDLYFQNLNGKSDTSTICLDMRGCTMFKWFNIFITDFYTGVFHGDNYSSYYNEYHAVDISTVGIGYHSTTLGNENIVFGGRVNDCDYGTRDTDNSHNKYIGCSIETFSTVAHQTYGSATQYITYSYSRMENAGAMYGTGIGVSTNSLSQETQIISVIPIGLATSFDDNGINTNIIAPENWKISGGSSIFRYTSKSFTTTFAPLAAGAYRQESFSFSGAAAGDSVTFTVGPNWPNGIIAGSASAYAGTIYVQIFNPHALTVTFASDTYVIDVIKHV